MPTKQDAIKALKKVEDPELMLDVYTLGLIYKIKIKEKDIHITMTFTSPGCPFAAQLIKEIKENLTKTGFKTIELSYTFEPPWKPSEEVKMMLGIA